MENHTNMIWTIGHSNRPWDEFVNLLIKNSIRSLVDIRTFPGSRKYPHFNKEHFEKHLHDSGIGYLHVPALGGRRKPTDDPRNSAWRNPSFRGFADHMLSDEFISAVASLQKIAKESRVAYMCSEALWWKCHRALVSDYLKNAGWKVLHISNGNKVQEHPYTSAARSEQGQLFYN